MWLWNLAGVVDMFKRLYTSVAAVGQRHSTTRDEEDTDVQMTPASPEEDQEYPNNGIPETYNYTGNDNFIDSNAYTGSYTGKFDGIILSPQTSNNRDKLLSLIHPHGGENQHGFDEGETSNKDNFNPSGTIDHDAALLLSPITSMESYNEAFSKVSIHHKANEMKYTSITDLPMEILVKIVEALYFDENGDYSSINAILENFTNISLVSNFFHLLSLKFLYKYANFNRPQSFQKFCNNLNNNPDLGNFVLVIDFETFTSIGLGRTGKMNQEIQMVTSSTILSCLAKTPNLIEFLASESIQDDLSVDVLNHLFNNLPYLQSLDFCGASSQSFLNAFESLIINKPLKNLFKISFHDCSNLPLDIFKTILPNLINLRRLDLTHTSITSTVLLNYLPVTCNLTHLSLSRCSKLTTRDLINFLINHPSVNNHQLQWLNLSIDSNVVSPLNSNYLFFTLNHLQADNLEYLNLKGLPINDKILYLINMKLQKLKTLSIGYSTIDFDNLYEFLVNNNSLLNIDLTGCKLNKSNIIQLMQLPKLMSIEFDSKILQMLTNNSGQFIRVDKDLIWKYFDNNGRRAWVYRLTDYDTEYGQILQYGKILNLNLTYYDINTGEKIEVKSKKPRFLKYMGKKINCSIGFKNLNYCKHKHYLNNFDLESVWPEEFCERGIYNYYSLNI